jgi:hypothetical protein
MFSFFSKKLGVPQLASLDSDVPDVKNVIDNLSQAVEKKSWASLTGLFSKFWNQKKPVVDVSGAQAVVEARADLSGSSSVDAIVVSLSQYSFLSCTNSDLKITISLPQALCLRSPVKQDVSVVQAVSDEEIYNAIEGEEEAVKPVSEQANPESETQPPASE